MCGIAGQVRSDGRPTDRSLVERMCEMHVHRGPDDLGIHLDGAAALGVRRLRVIDLDTGDQPVFNEDGSVAVVLNGEIYNYDELRRRLAGGGHRFSSKGDTEVIAHLYEERGPDCVHDLHGMFAFALWDARRRRLLLARDRIGKKPLLYAERPGALTFASEMRALLQDPEIPRDVDFGAIDRYLAHEYVPEPRSAFSAVRKLPPASRLVYEDGRATVERYWRLRYDLEAPDAGRAELEEELRERIRDAVRRRMAADVPLGALLSGGVDSAAVVAAMAEASPEPVKTFSIGFAEAEFDELPNARLVAERFATDHTELVIGPEAVSVVPEIVRHHGEPFADSSSVPSFLVCELARRDVTVALNGDGGDEDFAGYVHYSDGLRAERLARVLPAPLRRALGAVSSGGARRGTPLDRGLRAAHAMSLPAGERYAFIRSAFTAAERRRLYTPELERMVAASAGPDPVAEAWEAGGGDSGLDRMLEADVTTYLPGDLLAKMDIASMAHSLEARSPFLDHELMQFAASLPEEMKLRAGDRKLILRSALRGWIPDEVLDGPKRGFGLPMVGEWLRGALRDRLVETLTDSRALSRGHFREPELRALLDAHLSGRADNGRRLWALMMLESWQREFVDSPAPALSAAQA